MKFFFFDIAVIMYYEQNRINKRNVVALVFRAQFKFFNKSFKSTISVSEKSKKNDKKHCKNHSHQDVHNTEQCFNDSKNVEKKMKENYDQKNQSKVKKKNQKKNNKKFDTTSYVFATMTNVNETCLNIYTYDLISKNCENENSTFFSNIKAYAFSTTFNIYINQQKN